MTANRTKLRISKTSYSTSITTKNWGCPKTKSPLCLLSWMKVLTASSKRNHTKRLWICSRKHMVSWMPLTSPPAGEIFIICSLCFTTWPCATRRCRCWKNVPSASSMLLNSCPRVCSIWRRRASPTEWERSSSSASSSYSTVLFFRRFTDIRMRLNRPEKEWKCAIKCSMICTNSANSMSRERKSMLRTRIVSQMIQTHLINLMNIAVDLRTREAQEGTVAAETGRSATTSIDKRMLIPDSASTDRALDMQNPCYRLTRSRKGRLV